MEQDPCYLIEKNYGECESRLGKMIGASVTEHEVTWIFLVRTLVCFKV
jgi:hypothetical protein